MYRSPLVSVFGNESELSDPVRMPEESVSEHDVDGVMNELMSYNRRPDSVSEEIAETVSAILQISGKTARTLYNGLSLLKNPPEIQEAIRTENLPVSQGYLFAANLECPDRMQIFTNIMKTPVTNATLNNLLTAYKKVKQEPGITKPLPMTKQIASLRSFESRIEIGFAKYTKPDLVTLLDELHVFCALVEMRISIAPEPAPEKPGKKKPML